MSLPPPLVPAACDLVGLQWFPIDIDRLLGSQFHQCPDDGAWRAGVTLWLRSMRQVPAGSLPNDDEALVARAKEHPAAFAPLYRRYVGPIYGYCYQRLGTKELA